MAEFPDELKRYFLESNPKRCVWVNEILSYLGWACMIVGIVSDAINMKLGLVSTNWFILTIVFWIGSTFAWFRGYYSAKEK